MQTIYKGRYTSSTTGLSQTVELTIDASGVHLIRADGVTELWPTQEITDKRVSVGICELLRTVGGETEWLEVTDPAFAGQYLQLVRKRTIHKFWFNRIPALYRVFLFIMLLLGGLIWLLVPVLTNLAVYLLPKSTEISVGKTMMDAVLTGEKVMDEESLVINRFFHTILPNPEYPVRIVVVDKDIPNAFALPGGGIVVYTDMLHKTNSSEELAALLAHEYSHVRMRHATRGIFQQLAGSVVLRILFGDASGLGSILAGQAGNLSQLKFSRELETEADEGGYAILRDAQVNAEGMIALFQVLKKEGQEAPAEWLSTHPDLDNRISNTKRLMKEQSYTAVTNDSMVWYYKQLKTDW